MNHLWSIQSLEELACWNLKVVGNGESMQSLTPPKNLWSLQLYNVDLCEPVLVQLLLLCPNLSELAVHGENTVPGDGMAAILRASPNLWSGSLYQFAQLNSSCILAIAKLREARMGLSLGGTDVTDAGMAIILSKCHQLHEIELQGCRLLTKATVYAIARYCPLLRDLGVDGVEVTECALVRVVQCCPLLWRILLPRCEGLTDRGSSTWASTQRSCSRCGSTGTLLS